MTDFHPTAHLLIDHVPAWQVVRRQPPLVAGLRYIAKTVEDLAQRVIASPGILATQRQIGRYKCPLLICHIRLITKPICGAHDSIVTAPKQIPYPNTNKGTKCRLEMWRGGFRRCLSVSGPFVCRCLISRSLLRFHIPLVEPGHAGFPHPAHGGSITTSPTKSWQSAERAGPGPVAGRCSGPENGGSSAIALGAFCTATDGAFGEHDVRSRDKLR